MVDEIVLSLSRSLNPGVDRLRREAFLESGSLVSMLDEFDTASTHLVLALGQEPVAAVRTTHPPQQVFLTWTRGAAALPSNALTADIGRLCVSKKMCGLGLSKIIFARGLLATNDMGYEVANGTFSDERLLASFVDRYGAIQTGPAVTSYEPNHPALTVTPVIFDLVRNRSRYEDLFEQERMRLAARGYLYKELSPQQA